MTRSRADGGPRRAPRGETDGSAANPSIRRGRRRLLTETDDPQVAEGAAGARADIGLETSGPRPGRAASGAGRTASHGGRAVPGIELDASIGGRTAPDARHTASNGVRSAPGAGHTAALNARIVALAAGQCGLVAHHQLLAAGLGRGAIVHRVGTGSLLRVAPGVYAVGRPADHPNAPFAAALLALRGDGWIAGRSAGVLWRVLPRRPSDDVDVVVLGPPPRRRDGVRVRRTGRLDLVDRARCAELPVTSLARTFVDLAEDVDRDDLERAVAEGIAIHDLRIDAVRAAAARRPGTRGRATLRAVLDAADGPRRSRSEAEARFLRLVRDARLPVPLTDVEVLGLRVDALWRREAVVGEVDGFAFHRSRRKFDLDHERDARLQAAGFVVFRATWRQITEEPLATTARLASLLARREARTGARRGTDADPPHDDLAQVHRRGRTDP